MTRLARLVCASANPDKVLEIVQLLAGVADVSPRPPELADVVEDADTLEGNARLKATAVADATGLPAVADDTGLFVDALHGDPGVHTARYAGDGCTYADNRAKLLAALDGVPAPQRRAVFRTVAMVAWPGGRELMAAGECHGAIPDRERGERGFGYDAVFVPDGGGGRSFAEMTREEKNGLSHRGAALRALAEGLTPAP